jgi:hypothetical protein
LFISGDSFAQVQAGFIVVAIEAVDNQVGHKRGFVNDISAHCFFAFGFDSKVALYFIGNQLDLKLPFINAIYGAACR